MTELLAEGIATNEGKGGMNERVYGFSLILQCRGKTFAFSDQSGGLPE